MRFLPCSHPACVDEINKIDVAAIIKVLAIAMPIN